MTSPVNVKRCAHYQITGTESFISIVWKLQILGRKNLWGGPFDLPPPPLEVPGLTHVLTLFSLWGGGGGGLLMRNSRQFKIILSYHRTFPRIYLAVWWCGRILVMGSDIAMATAIWRACLAEIWISCLFFTLNWIAMPGIKYFGHLEHYCFEKNNISDFFGRSVTSPMTSCRFKCKL